MKRFTLCLLGLLAAGTVWAESSNSFIVATYNVANWNFIERSRKPNLPKPTKEKEGAWTALAALKPDVLGVEEMGDTNDLAEFVAGLKKRGLDYPYTEWVAGPDTSRHVALLSRFPITQRFSATNDTYQLDHHPARVSRGILDVQVQVNPTYSFRAIVLHLKSKRTIEGSDQAQMRLAEAKLARAHVDAILKADPRQNIVVMGDFNDTPETAPVQAIAGTSSTSPLYVLPAKTDKGYVNTHFWMAHKEWSRIDYLMVSPGMSNEFVTGTATIYEGPGAKEGSDHRPVSGTFYATDRDPQP
jgi:endonuclease/exonuclease/phosphatase family metal-dependent hydrolase